MRVKIDFKFRSEKSIKKYDNTKSVSRQNNLNF